MLINFAQIPQRTINIIGIITAVVLVAAIAVIAISYNSRLQFVEGKIS